jgi:mono/diheme cytochrome c family protein
MENTEFEFNCTKCHDWRGKRARRGTSNRSHGPELTGYGSRQWLIDFVRNPAHPRFYGPHNDRMPAYGQQKILTDAEIALVVDWLRGDWTEPGRPWNPPDIAVAMASSPPTAITPRPAAGANGDDSEKKGTDKSVERAAGQPIAGVSDKPATAPAPAPVSATTPAETKPSADAPSDKPESTDRSRAESPSTAPSTQPTTNPSTGPTTAPATSKPLDTPPPPKRDESSSRVPYNSSGVVLPSAGMPVLLLAGPPATAPVRPPPSTAPAPGGKVDFVAHVKPILESRCVKCHGPVRPTNGYRIYTKEFAFKPGDSDEAPIVAGRSSASNLYQLITAKDPDHRMPQKGPPLAPEQIATIRRWIDQGAVWPDNLQLDTSAAKDDGGKKK